MNLRDIAILKIKMLIIVVLLVELSKSEAIKLLQNTDLIEKK